MLQTLGVEFRLTSPRKNGRNSRLHPVTFCMSTPAKVDVLIRAVDSVLRHHEGFIRFRHGGLLQAIQGLEKGLNSTLLSGSVPAEGPKALNRGLI